eukprot:TRINITY_DN28216_c0_g1_i2.p1 TRINITY_DN28216_c0_g1~~TRINITY_DN28216_c0_g1_i2.p1  ORF type:complete len:258 (+),score=34.76 TRINITY_DN28216_c0_g1_i2:110-883(+)
MLHDEADAPSLIFHLHSALLRGLAARSDRHFEGLAQAARLLKLPSRLRKRCMAVDTAFQLVRHITKVSAQTCIDEVLAAADSLTSTSPGPRGVVSGDDLPMARPAAEVDHHAAHDAPSGREAHVVPTPAHVPLHPLALPTQVSNEIHHMSPHRQTYADIADVFTKHTKDAVDTFIDQYAAQGVDYPPELMEKQLVTVLRRGFLGLVPALADAPPLIAKFINKLIARGACLTAVRAAARKRSLDPIDESLHYKMDSMD